MAEEFRKYDSDDMMIAHNVRLAKDAQVIPTNSDKGQMVKLTFVSTSKSDRHEDLWVEATITDWDADKAALLEKGDVLTIEGKPALRRWGDNNEKVSFELLRARLHLPIAMFGVLKERGFAPGESAAKPKGKPVAVAEKTMTHRARQIVDLDDDEP